MCIVMVGTTCLTLMHAGSGRRADPITGFSHWPSVAQLLRCAGAHKMSVKPHIPSVVPHQRGMATANQSVVTMLLLPSAHHSRKAVRTQRASTTLIFGQGSENVTPFQYLESGNSPGVRWHSETPQRPKMRTMAQRPQPALGPSVRPCC
jgi:hypothetical protein